eukprot:GCRY01005280.1.p1 GENE.GCRY01005280.1~~GCRY01005280.1.p1  ORF type:complete len:440 (-),score=62.28 GCRY01005280.1:278-1597(-)
MLLCWMKSNVKERASFLNNILLHFENQKNFSLFQDLAPSTLAFVSYYSSLLELPIALTETIQNQCFCEMVQGLLHFVPPYPTHSPQHSFDYSPLSEGRLSIFHNQPDTDGQSNESAASITSVGSTHRFPVEESSLISNNSLQTEDPTTTSPSFGPMSSEFLLNMYTSFPFLMERASQIIIPQSETETTHEIWNNNGATHLPLVEEKAPPPLFPAPSSSQPYPSHYLNGEKHRFPFGRDDTSVSSMKQKNAPSVMRQIDSSFHLVHSPFRQQLKETGVFLASENSINMLKMHYSTRHGAKVTREVALRPLLSCSKEECNDRQWSDPAQSTDRCRVMTELGTNYSGIWRGHNSTSSSGRIQIFEISGVLTAFKVDGSTSVPSGYPTFIIDTNTMTGWDILAADNFSGPEFNEIEPTSILLKPNEIGFRNRINSTQRHFDKL